MKFLQQQVTPELKLAALLSRPILLDCQHEKITQLAKEVDLEHFLVLIDQHRIWPCVFCNIKNFFPDLFPKALTLYLQNKYQVNAGQSKQQFITFCKILSIFKEEGISVRPLKGITLAQSLYGDLTLRQSRDIDIIISARNVDCAARVLTEHGYRAIHLADLSEQQKYIYFKVHKDITFLSNTGLIIELHIRVCEYPTSFSSYITNSLFQAGSKQIKQSQELLYLCWHGTHSLFHRLKWLLDITLFIEKNSRALDANMEDVLAMASKIDGLRPLVISWILANAIYDIDVPPKLERFYQQDWLAQFEVKMALGLLNNPRSEKSISFKLLLYLGEVLLSQFTTNKCLVFVHKFKPTILDLKALPVLPNYLTALYYIARPLRILYFRFLPPVKPKPLRSPNA